MGHRNLAGGFLLAASEIRWIQAFRAADQQLHGALGVLNRQPAWTVKAFHLRQSSSDCFAVNLRERHGRRVGFQTALLAIGFNFRRSNLGSGPVFDALEIGRALIGRALGIGHLGIDAALLGDHTDLMDTRAVGIAAGATLR